ncbi:MAG: hypothetical protein KKF68_03990 [Nanoarchaeota archaeon]|nr:hypothetical protein [Nanoarchaeota archaeon]
MKKFTSRQIQGILLLIAAILMFVSIPFIEGKTIGAIIVVIIGLYNLFK